MAKKTTTSSAKFTEDWLPIVDIKNGYIKVKGDGLLGGEQYVTGVRIEPKNIFITDTQNQAYVINALMDFYNTMHDEFWLICCDRPVDINLFKSELEIMYNEAQDPQIRKLIQQDIRKCEEFSGPKYNSVDTEFFILIKGPTKNIEQLQKRIANMISGLAQAQLNARQITDDDARVILDSFFNDGIKTEFGTVMS
ncbi:MAG: hypothetical protein K6E99_01660 [Bacilli bacterium]|nr:hypothetical protein [Bacilli bacterium]